MYHTTDIWIDAIPLHNVFEYDKIKYNSNNHYGTERPLDYFDVLLLGSTHYWIDDFRDHYIVINIDSKQLYWMKQAHQIGEQTKKFSSLYKEDLEDFLEMNKHLNYLFTSESKYFVRAENVSLKYGCHGVGPYVDLKSIIESLVTSSTGHTPIEKDTSEIKLYLLPWINIITDKEFRVFVYKNKITAISQQHLYQVNELLYNMNDCDRLKTISIWINIIVNYFNNVISKKISHIDSYVMDIALLDDNEPFFIEINSFGKEYASGSALFHWILNENILYDSANENIVYFRYVI